MRHNKDDKRFDRQGGHLRSMFSNMTNSLILHGRIKTTTPKAKLLRRYAERMITLGKKATLPSRRRAMAFMRSKTAVTKLFADIAPGYMDRSGGYTRILKVGRRVGDNAPMSIIELVETEVKKPATKRAGAKKTAAKPVKKPSAKAPQKAAAPKKETTAKKAAPVKKAPANKKPVEQASPAKKAAEGKKAAQKTAGKAAATAKSSGSTAEKKAAKKPAAAKSSKKKED